MNRKAIFTRATQSTATGQPEPGDCHPLADNYEKSVAVTSDILCLSSMKINTQCNARTGRDYCCVGPKRTEKRKKRRRKMWVHAIICDGRDKGIFWTIFEDLRRNEANCFRMSVDS
jgi:hypothetical protein